MRDSLKGRPATCEYGTSLRNGGLSNRKLAMTETRQKPTAEGSFSDVHGAFVPACVPYHRGQSWKADMRVTLIVATVATVKNRLASSKDPPRIRLLRLSSTLGGGCHFLPAGPSARQRRSALQMPWHRLILSTTDFTSGAVRRSYSFRGIFLACVRSGG